MKTIKITICIIFVFGFISAKAQINIPDTNFKMALTLSAHADLGNDTLEIADANGDGEIQISEAQAVIGLYLTGLFIADLEGLQYFVNLEEFDCNENNQIINIPTMVMPNLRVLLCSMNSITNLDVTQNPLLEILRSTSNNLTSIDVSLNSNLIELNISSNQLTSLDITQNLLLEKLRCQNNQLTSLDITQNLNLVDLHCENNSLTSIDLSQNVNLMILYINDNLLNNIEFNNNILLTDVYMYNNLITNINVSQNINLEILSSFNNLLTSVNIQNGNNENLIGLLVQDNPNLTCIQVDNVSYANSQSNWHKDETANYSTDCALSISDNQLNLNVYPNPVKDLLFIETNNIIKKIEIYNVLGKLVLTIDNNSKKLNLKKLKTDLYYLKVETENGFFVKKIMKKQK